MSRRAFRLGAAMLALLVGAPVTAARVRAQDAQPQVTSKDRLSLTVRGKAQACADEVAIDLTVSGSAEEATEAEKKYRDKLARVLNALGKGDGKTPVDEDAPKKRRKKKDDAADTTGKKKKKADDTSDDEDAAPAKKKKKASDDSDDEATPAKKKKKPAIDESDDEDATPVKKKKDKKDDAEDGKKDDAKKDDAKKDDAKKDDAKKDDKKGDAAKKDEKKPDETAKKDEKKPEEDFPFVVDVKEGGLSFGVKGGDQNAQMRRRMMGQQGGKEEPEFRFSSTLSIIFKSVAKADPKALRKKIADILDKVSDAGVDTAITPEGDGSPPVVRFACADPEDLKLKAYADAMGAARKRGQSLATLADRSLGKVVSVRDQTALPQSSHKQVYNPYQYGYGYQVTTQLGEDWSTEVVMEVDLYVEFELKDKPGDAKK